MFLEHAIAKRSRTEIDVQSEGSIYAILTFNQRLCSCTSVIYTVENPTNYVTTATLTADDNL